MGMTDDDERPVCVFHGGFLCMKDYDFQTLLSRFLKVNEAFNNLYKFEYEKTEEAKKPTEWSLDYE